MFVVLACCRSNLHDYGTQWYSYRYIHAHLACTSELSECKPLLHLVCGLQHSDIQKMENTKAQTTVMNVSALPSFNYPLYMDPEGNQSQPLYSVHTLQKRQIQSDVQQGTVKCISFSELYCYLCPNLQTSPYVADKARGRLGFMNKDVCETQFIILSFNLEVLQLHISYTSYKKHVKLFIHFLQRTSRLPAFCKSSILGASW